MGLGREHTERWRGRAALLSLVLLSAACGGTSHHSSSSAAGSDGDGSSGGRSAGSAVAQAGAAVAEAGSGGATAHGGSGAGGMPSEPVAPFEGTTVEYWIQVAETGMARQEECFGVPSAYGELGSNVVSAHFLIEHELKQRLRDFQPSIDAGRVRFDRQAAGACLHRMLWQSCQELLLDLSANHVCVDDALVGLIEPGGACERSVECASRDLFCYGESSQAPTVCQPLSGPGESCDFIACAKGNECVQAKPNSLEPPALTCVPAPPKREGEACNGGGCAEGLYCVNLSCRAYQPGMPCAANFDCLYLEVCLKDPTGAKGHCGRARNEGEPCSGTPGENDCAFSFDCRANEQKQLVCTSVWAPVGALCRNTGGNGGIVCIDGYCDVISSANQQGVCVAAAQLGEECYSGSCAPGLDCTAAGCQPESF